MDIYDSGYLFNLFTRSPWKCTNVKVYKRIPMLPHIKLKLIKKKNMYKIKFRNL